MTYFFIGLVVGIFVPAPYDAIVINNVKKGWAALKGMFQGEGS